MKPKKILTIVPFPFLPPQKGGEWCAYYSSEFLAKHRPMVLASTKNNKIYPATFSMQKAFEDQKSKYLHPKTLRSLESIAASHTLKGVFLHQPFMGYWAYKLSQKHRVPLVVYVHNLEFKRFKSMGKPWWPILEWLEKWLYQRADYLLFISEKERTAAIKQWQLTEAKCLYVPYGVLQEKPVQYNSLEARSSLGFDPDKPLFLFFGSMKYQPNIEAVNLLVDDIAPAWERLGFGKAQWIICGGGLSEEVKQKLAQQPHFQYMGFVDPLAAYLQAADVMVNPVMSGGGVKTKVMEALSWGTTVVSTEEGAAGIDRTNCANKLILSPNGNWEEFARTLKAALPTANQYVDQAFYDQYHWKSVMGKVAEQVFPPESW